MEKTVKVSTKDTPTQTKRYAVIAGIVDTDGCNVDDILDTMRRGYGNGVLVGYFTTLNTDYITIEDATVELELWL